MSAQDLAANKAAVRRYLDEAWNKGNLDVIDELMAPDYARYTPAAQLDREGQKQRIAGFRQALPDVHLDVDRIVAEDDHVAFRVVIRGAHQGPLLGVAPTGQSVTFTATDIVRIVNGKIVEHWGNMDELGLLRQLGAFPPRG
ncbi:MAG TPA: ester cyclase [Ktedonobacterales bacterium]|nr:ester cyclase [Ktedonobacterales bacterium]